MSITDTIVPASVVPPTARGVYGDQGPDPYEAAQGQQQDLSFADFLDIINPLQHIPIINTIYREVTGDTISPVARMIGGGLYGGPVGLLASAVNNAVEAQTGGDIGANLLAAVTGQDLEATAASSSQLAVAVPNGEGAPQAAAPAAVPTIGAAAEAAPQGGMVPAAAEQAALVPQAASAAETLAMPAASGSQFAMQQALAAAQQTIYGAPRSAPLTPAAMERAEAVRRPASAQASATPAVAAAAPSREAPTLIAQAVPATASAAPAQVSDAMLKALDKYDAMVKARKATGAVNAVS